MLMKLYISLTLPTKHTEDSAIRFRFGW